MYNLKDRYKQFFFEDFNLKVFYCPFIDLQLFAKPEDEGRTQEATATKKRKARQEGKVAYSQELVSAIVLISSLILLYFMGWFFIDSSKAIFINSFSSINLLFDKQFAIYAVRNSIFELLFVVAPIFGIVFVVSLIANFSQVGFHFSTKTLKFNFKKISFTSNKMFSKIFFSRQTAFNLVKSSFKVLLISVLTYFLIYFNIEFIVNIINMENAIAFSNILSFAFIVIIITAIIFLLLSVPDYFFQKQEHALSLKMSHQELKEERRDTEGDMLIKQRLRDRQRSLLNRKFKEEVPKADVVITNPTHYAIAICYDSDSMTAPIVVAKGRDYMALRIKEIAIDNDVHIVEDRVLARSLYDVIDVGDEIPEQFYQALAEILAFVIKSRDKLRGAV